MCLVFFLFLFLFLLILDIILLKILRILFIHTEIPQPHFSVTFIAIIMFCLKLLEAGQDNLPYTVTLYHMDSIHGHILSQILISCDVETSQTFGTIFCCFSTADAVVCAISGLGADEFFVLSSKESLFFVTVVHFSRNFHHMPQ